MGEYAHPTRRAPWKLYEISGATRDVLLGDLERAFEHDVVRRIQIPQRTGVDLGHEVVTAGSSTARNLDLELVALGLQRLELQSLWLGVNLRGTRNGAG